MDENISPTAFEDFLVDEKDRRQIELLKEISAKLSRLIELQEKSGGTIVSPS